MALYTHKFSLLSLSIISLLHSPLVLAEDADAEVQSIERITVLGEKTARSLKDTTSSVSVISEEQLANGQHLAISDAIAEMANVVVLTGALPNVRGVSGNGSASGFASFTGGAKARISTITDGVVEPFIADLTGDTGLWDVAQIEVFRGPQSTSNGRNSIAGSIFIKTNDPSFDWDGAARVGYRNQDSFIDSAVMLTGPVVEDTLAFRISAQNVAGDTYNKGFEYPDNPANFDLNELKSQRLRTKLLWQPNQNDDLQLLYTYAYNKESGNSGRNFFTGDDPWNYVPLWQRDMLTESSTHSINLDYKLDPDSAIEVIVANMDYDWGFYHYEKTPQGDSWVNMNDNSTSLDAKYSFGILSADFNGFIGFAHYERRQDFSSTGANVYWGDDKSESNAVYGEVTYKLADAYKLVAGGRVEKEKQRRDFTMESRTGLVGDKLNTSKTIFLPKIALQYIASQNTTYSASARKGYNSAGGALSRENEYYYFDEESVNTYEVGVRSSFNNGNFNLSANLFYNDYKGYQALNTVRKINNLDGVNTYGLELETNTVVTDDLHVKFGIGLLESEITKGDPTFDHIIGNELNNAPSVTANLALSYWFNDAISSTIATNYVGEYFGDYENTPERIAGDYTITRINLDYQNDNWRVSGYINNLFDEKALTVKEPPGWYPTGYGAVVDPRTVGISLTYTYGG